jgi:hypothetical protein
VTVGHRGHHTTAVTWPLSGLASKAVGDGRDDALVVNVGLAGATDSEPARLRRLVVHALLAGDKPRRGGAGSEPVDGDAKERVCVIADPEVFPSPLDRN